MGAGYTIISVVDVPPEERESAYFRGQGIVFRPPSAPARRPTPRDVRRALERLSDCTVEYTPTGSSLDSMISSTESDAWAFLWINNYAGESSDDQPCSLYVQKGWEDLVLRIVAELARECGPFIVLLNNEEPRLVS